MPAKISGIAVYPLEKFKLLKEDVLEDQKYREDNLIKVKTSCNVMSVPCTKEVKIRMDPRLKYRMACAISCENPNEVSNYSVEGAIKKTFGPLIADKELQKRTFNDGSKDLNGHYRHWWDWEYHFPQWTEFGRYDVKLILTNKKDKKSSEITIPVTFSETDYPKHGIDIDPMC
ncbi:hypothetical protein [Methanolacinia paynteri]|uniref:hypothetical protein n=1 Tax=Methanolacinia paynteri TaxID=230356 RepID=UPI00064E9420|nr:hypothetical protein [Methanolacinia paynteri]